MSWSRGALQWHNAKDCPALLIPKHRNKIHLLAKKNSSSLIPPQSALVSTFYRILLMQRVHACVRVRF
ncbi:unnamed protein product [Ixodes pacificus]